jgi:hypothetical protein
MALSAQLIYNLRMKITSIKIARVLALLVFSFLFAFSLNAADDKLNSYDLYDHQLLIETLRAGNHDASGVNDYYFTITLSALSNSADALKKDVKDRATIKQDLGKFGELNIPVLTTWTQDPKAATGGSMSFEIKGDLIRTMVSDAMRQFKLGEQEVAMRVQIEMYEKEKKFGFWGTDTLVGQTEYYPIPPSKYQVGGRMNIKLSLIDDKGTEVRFKIIYAKPETKLTASAPKDPSETPSPTTTPAPQ